MFLTLMGIISCYLKDFTQTKIEEDILVEFGFLNIQSSYSWVRVMEVQMGFWKYVENVMP